MKRAACSEELVLDESWPASYPCCWRRRGAPPAAPSGSWCRWGELLAAGDPQPFPLAVRETNECKCLYLQLIYVNIYSSVINWASVAAYICFSRPLTWDQDLVVVIIQRRLYLQNILLLLPLKGKVTKRWFWDGCCKSAWEAAQCFWKTTHPWLIK